MFVAWQSRPLSTRGFYREGDACKHVAGDPGRDATLVPLVSVSERVDGKPRRRVAHRFGASIRPCCIVDVQTPRARLEFWRAVERSWQRATSPVLLERDALTMQLAARVSLPTEEERLLWEVWQGGGASCQLRQGMTEHDGAVAMWASVKARLERYRQRRQRGESYADWNAREPAFTYGRGDFLGEAAAVEPPPGFTVLGLVLPCSTADVQAAWKRLAAGAHPDRGGDHADFVALGQARDEALAWLARAA